MWKALQEGSSVLPQLKQITPSDRTGVSGNEGIGDRSEVGKTPESGQKKIWGNLNAQSRGQEGKLDTQGKDSPQLFTSHKGATKENTTGTSTPSQYKKMYAIKESANATETGVSSGKHKETTALSNPTIKNVKGADTNHGGSCNASCKKSTPVTESQLIGSTVAMVAAKTLNEAFNIKIK